MATFSSAGPKLDKETLGELGMLKILRELEELAKSRQLKELAKFRQAQLSKSTDFTNTNLSNYEFLFDNLPEDIEDEVFYIADEIGQLIVNKNAPEKEIAVDVDTFAGMDVDGLPVKVDPVAFRQVVEMSDWAPTMQLLDGPRPSKNKVVTRMIKWQKEYEKKLLAQAVKQLRQTNPRLVEEAAKIQSDLKIKIDGR
jgi:hypothetical protein